MLGFEQKTAAFNPTYDWRNRLAMTIETGEEIRQGVSKSFAVL